MWTPTWMINRERGKVKIERTSRGLLAIVMVASLAALVQTQEQPKPGADAKHFAKDGLSFDYPADWQLSDQSTSQMQVIQLLRNGYAEIRVRAPREWLKTPQKEAEAKRLIQDQYLDSFVKTVEQAGLHPTRANITTQIAGSDAEGTRVRAVLDGEPGGMDAYYCVLSDRFVQLSILGSEREIARSTPAWDSIRSSVQLEVPPVPTPTPAKQKP